MKIATPPRIATRSEFNLTKQAQVVDRVYDPRHDHLLEVPLCSTTLEECHDPGFVAAVRRGKLANGFGDYDPAVLAHAEHSCAALFIAANAALDGDEDGVHCAFAPVSGFHHAGYRSNGGYCTFNGLMDTALHLNRTAGRRVLILDGDGHFGDGTENILQELRIDHRQIANWWIAQPGVDWAWQNGLNKSIQRYDLVLYQAGADAHEEDPYGAGSLDDGEWRVRDEFIFRTCKEAGVPVVWNLAGGYNGQKTVNLHLDTFRSALKVFYPDQARRVFDGAGDIELIE